MVVKFNVKKDVLLGAVRKAAGSWIRTKERALSVRSDGQGNYKVCVQSNGLYVAGCTFPAAPVGAEGEITVVVSEMFLGAVNALASLDADEFSIEIKEDRVIVALGTGEVEVPVIKEPKTSFELPGMYPLGALRVQTSELKKCLNSVLYIIDKGDGAQWMNCVGMIPYKNDDVTKLSFIGSGTVGIATSNLSVEESTLNGAMPNMAVPVAAFSTAAKYLGGEITLINIMAKGEANNLGESSKPFALLLVDSTGATFLISLHSQEYSAKMLDIAVDTNNTAKFKATVEGKDIANAIRVASVGEEHVGVVISEDKKGIGIFESKTRKKGAVVKANTSGELAGDVIVNGYYLSKCVSIYSGDILIKSNIGGVIGEPAVVCVVGNEGFSILLPIKNRADEKVHSNAANKAEKDAKEEKTKDAEINGEE